jgi:hypothetical protein
VYTRNERVGFLFVTQPTSVDCIIDDLAVESQLFALSFVQSASLDAASLAVTVLGNNGISLIASYAIVLMYE